MPAGSGDADELRHRGLAPLVRVAHGTAEADDGIEGVVVEAVEVGDVRDDPVDDAILEPCFGQPTPVELKLARREVRDDDVGVQVERARA